VRRFFWDDEEIPYERAEAAVREAVEDFGATGSGSGSPKDVNTVETR
jgi:hypothetical protein